MKTVFKFKKDQKIHLDDTYNIASAIDGEKIWWVRDNDEAEELTVTENVTITIDVKITQ